MQRKKTKENAQRIVEYLQYVKENPEEYVAMRAAAAEETSSGKPVKVLIGLAQAYSKASHNFIEPQSLVLQAAYELGLKHQLPVCSKLEQYERRRLKRILTAVRTKTSKDKPKTPQQKPAEVRKPKVTDMEQFHAEIETWLKGLTTMQMLKAREMALKHMGESEKSIRKWWVAQKNCRYLRTDQEPD